MEGDFNAEFFRANRARLRELFTGRAPIVITGSSQVQQSADTAYPFTQDKNFWYLTGIDVADAVLVMEPEKEYIILPPRSSVQDTFDGAFDASVFEEISGVRSVHDSEAGWKILDARLKKVKHVATLSPLPAYLDVYGMFTNPARRVLARRMRSVNPELELLDIRDHVARLRSIKQPVELEAIQSAIMLTAKAIEKYTTAKKLEVYRFAYELEADIRQLFAKSGSDHAFSPIISSGKQSCVLHSVDLKHSLGEGELVQLDIGASFHGYAADISRARASGEPSKRQQAIHAAVLEVQSYALGLLKPGVLLRDYEQKVEQFMGEKLRELLLIKTISSEAVREYFPHATSHFLGLDTHDVGDYDRPLEPGMVITCEPGIYVPAEGIGVRIEDDILITATGNENLSSSLTRDLLQ